MTLYFFSHLIQSLLFPPGVNFFIALIGFVVWRRSHILGKSLVAFAFISLWLLCMPIIAWRLIDNLQKQYSSPQMSNVIAQNNTSAIVVLGGGSVKSPEYENRETVSLATLARLQYAAYLHEKMHLPIIVSGGKANSALAAEADLMAEILARYFQIAASWKEDQSINTSDEARFLMPLFKEHHVDTIYLVTNAWHMPRSIYVFKQTGLNVIPAPMGYVTKTSKLSFLDCLPSSEGLSTSIMAIHEYVGLLWYRLYYRNKL